MIHFSADPTLSVMSVLGIANPVLVSCQGVLGLLPFVSIGQGSSSGIVDLREVVVASEAAWKALWAEHAPGGPPPPAIDFTSELVVGIFAGQRPSAGYLAEIVRVERESGGLNVVYRIGNPANDAMVAEVLTAPFHLVRLQRLGLPVHFKKL